MKKHRMTTKALSMLLTVIMLFTTISVGIIVPESDIIASAAEGKTFTLTSADAVVAELQAAIKYANENPTLVTRIELTKSITRSGALDKLPAISGNIVFDFKGYPLTFEYKAKGDYHDKGDIQIPTENATSRDFLAHALFTVAGGGTLQFIDSGNLGAAALQLITDVENTRGNESGTVTTSSSLILNSGTLILGDKNDPTKNTFTLMAHSSARCTNGNLPGSNGYKSVNVDSYAITVSGTDAQFKMYGGTVRATGTGRIKFGNSLRSATGNISIYALNINSCYTAEIYGGTIEIPATTAINTTTGMTNAGNANMKGSTMVLSAIRCNTPNLYIFDVDSNVYAEAGTDTNKDNKMYLSNVYSTSAANAAHVYGGSYSFSASSNSGNTPARIESYLVRGECKTAGAGNLDYTDTAKTNYGYKSFQKSSGNNSWTMWSVFATNDGSARNGLDMFSFGSIGDFLGSYSETSDGYFGNAGITNSTTAVPAVGKYFRNGYTHTGWTGKTTPGGTYSTETNTPALSYVSSNGGSLFLAPTWTPTMYNINYNFDETSQYQVTNKDTFAKSYSKYKITTTEEIPAPERPGFTFDGWKVDATVREATDSDFSWIEWTAQNNHKYGGWNTVTNTPVNMSVNGQYGDITLTATWKPVTYTIGVDTNADGRVDASTGDLYVTYANGTVNGSQTIPNWIDKNYYDFAGYYEVKESDNGSSWNINDVITVAVLKDDGTVEKYDNARISAQLAGKYGNVIRLTPKFIPKQYTISFDMDDDNNREDRPSADDRDYTYNVETVRALPILTPPGQRFNGWRVVASDGNWVTGRVYKSIPAGMHGNVSFIADYEDKEYEIEIVLGEGEFFDISPLGYGYTFKEGGTIEGIATKNGWDFDGWEVISSWSDFEGDTPDWTTGEIYYYDEDARLTYFDGGKVGNVRVKPHFVKHGYEITFNANSGAAVATKPYKIDETAELPTTTRAGWTFGGWVVSDTVGGWVKGDIYPAGDIDLTGLWGNVTLVAKWTETPYTVTLDLNGGEGVSNKAPGYITTASTALRETPVKTGYTFKGWEISSLTGNWNDYKTKLETTGAYITDAVPAGYYGNVTLRAVWEPTVYSMQFVRFPESNRTYTYEDTIVLPSASAPGQNFMGWQLSDNTGNWISSKYNAGATFTNKYGNVTFTPLFDAKTYTINFVDADGVTAIGSSVNYRFTDTFSLSTFDKPGYTFIGWKVNNIANPADCGGWTVGDEFTAGAMDAGRFYGNVTLKAVYEINDYKITFITDGGEPIADMAYTTESSAVLPKPVKTGYDFGGWKVTTADGSWILNSSVVDGTALKGKYGNVTLTALWSAHYYTISWVVDGKTTTTRVAYGDMPSFNGTPSKAQDAQYTYEFIGWTPSLDAVTTDMTYTAQFKSNLRIYSVTWKYLASDAAGTAETVVSETYKYGEKPAFPDGTPEKESSDDNKFYRFAGWYDENNNRLDNTTTVKADVVYTALFTEVQKDEAIKVTWKVDGATYETYWVANDTPVYPGTNKLADKDGFSREISGWKEGETDYGFNLPAVSREVVYTAKVLQRIKDYQATFDLKGGKYDGQTVVTYNRGEQNYLVMPQPEKAGYTFMGWKVTKTENADNWEFGSTYTEDFYKGLWGDVSFEAVWKATEYTLTVRTDSGENVTKYTIESNSIIAPLTKEGYDLTGWLVLTAEAGSGWMMGDTLPTEKSLLGMYGNVTIEPVWSAKTYNLNWVSGDTIQTVSVRYGEYIVSYAPVSKAGYTAKWAEEIPLTMPAHDVTINAVYTPIQYFVRFNTNGAGTVDGFYYNIESTAELPVLTREGADFGGWKVSAGDGSWLKDDVYDGGMALTGKYGNVTLTAVWKYKIYEITWKVEGSPDRVTKWYYGAQPSYDGTPYKAPDFNNSYEFADKWLTVTGEEITEIPVVTGNATYEAVFNAVERTYTVKWDVDGKVYEQTYTYGQPVECPFSDSNPPVRPSTNEYDFTFLGWSPEVTIVTGDVTYTAIFDVYTKIQGLRVDKTAIFIDINDSANVSAIISPSTATSKDVEWVSLNQNIATVNENGKIVGVSAGETLVRVQSKDGKFRAFCLVSVAPVTTDYIVVSAAGVSTTRLPGEAIQLYATIMPENASNKIIKWTTSNPAVATVDANGLVVFGSATGTAVITAMSDGYASGSITVTCTTDDSVINDNVKTYVVMFTKSSSSYILAGQTYESINIICKEGDTLEFLLTEPHFVTLNATQFERDTDGVYRIKNIKENYTVLASERPDLGFEPDEPEEDNGTEKLSFFDKLKAFFRSIVEFFRGLFGG